MFRPKFVDHLVFRVSDIDRTARFYSALLGEPYRADGYVMYSAGRYAAVLHPIERGTRSL